MNRSNSHEEIGIAKSRVGISSKFSIKESANQNNGAYDTWPDDLKEKVRLKVIERSQHYRDRSASD